MRKCGRPKSVEFVRPQMLESEQLKNVRKEVARVKEETVQLRDLAEESVHEKGDPCKWTYPR